MVGVGDRKLLDDVSWQLGPGDRVGVGGVNGSGKTWLLQVLASGLVAGSEPVPGSGLVAGSGPVTGWVSVAGSVSVGKTVRLGYLTQEPAPVDPDLRVLEAAEQV